ncbi:MAG: phytanoyl-CoA dioxygenase family protein [Caldilineaceae bacterium]|nr:phytanoyl-CoA dioxygenase family protein [Caldilineaceae bacterium]
MLTTVQMASFVARGFLRFDDLIPTQINEAVMAEIDAGAIVSPAAGTPLSHCYPPPSALGEMLRLPQVQGIIQSMVGADPGFDHHAIHVRQPQQGTAQGLHGDSIIDTRMHFDIQLMYFPHDVPLEMGGTLLVPGSQFRRVNEMDIARYQNILGQIPMVCGAGSLLALHHGIWHCGRRNQTDRVRYMYKIRLNPRVRQLRLWNTDDLDEQMAGDPFTTQGRWSADDDSIYTILARREPWYENASGRLEVVNRIKLWRFLTGDDRFDVQYWLTRLENMPENLPLAA